MRPKPLAKNDNKKQKKNGRGKQHGLGTTSRRDSSGGRKNVTTQKKGPLRERWENKGM